MKILTTIRNNWKKSLFGFCATTYGTYYLIERKHNADLLRAYCFEALKYSKERVHPTTPIKRVTIFLNPVANGERGKFLYDNNVAPLLHLSGLDVRLVRLDKNSEANEYMKALDMTDTDCIVVAGGNATLNECISGLISRSDSNDFLKKIPIGIIPIGETNVFANKWFSQLGIQKTDESEIRMMADSAFSIIRGLSQPADLMKVSLIQKPSINATGPAEISEDDELDERGAYSLLKENQIYALSNVSCGFVPETDAQVGKYWYFGWMRKHMNRYFTDRYLRRQPLKHSFDYKMKCHGCSKCLNEADLRTALDNFINKKNDSKIEKVPEQVQLSLIQKFYRKFIGIGNFQIKETPEMKENRLKKINEYEDLIQKSQTTNNQCGKLFQASLIQSQIEANINQDPVAEAHSPSSVETVIVKDPKFNFDDMYLAHKRELSEFEITKSNTNSKNLKFKRPADNLENWFCIEIDGEIYKLNNQPGHELKIRVEHLEKEIQLLRIDQEFSNSVQVNFWPQIYKNQKSPDDMPPIRPFENLYIDFSKQESLSEKLHKLIHKEYL